MDCFDDLMQRKPWWRELRGLPPLPPPRHYTVAEAQAALNKSMTGFIAQMAVNVNRDYESKFDGRR